MAKGKVEHRGDCQPDRHDIAPGLRQAAHGRAVERLGACTVIVPDDRAPHPRLEQVCAECSADELRPFRIEILARDAANVVLSKDLRRQRHIRPSVESMALTDASLRLCPLLAEHVQSTS